MNDVPESTAVADPALLWKLLEERNQNPERAAQIDAEVNRAFGRKVAILVMDMCGFSHQTVTHGIIHFLAMIHKMRQAAVPAITGNGGQVIKMEADNIFAIFLEPKHALEAALDIFRACEAINAVTPLERRLYGSIGIGFGETLIIGNEDLFGCEMNFASKLGEDVAQKMEILLTADAYEALPAERYNCAPVPHNLGGKEGSIYRFQSCLYARLPVKPVVS